jgi:lysophospholipid acyltransferase (LPLAT)-like uncharacterized protein
MLPRELTLPGGGLPANIRPLSQVPVCAGGMKRKQRLRLMRLAAWLLAGLIGLWLRTMRIRTVSADGRQHPVDPATQRYFYAFWHEALLAPLATGAKARVLISTHTDGELIAGICQRLGVGVIRGSTAKAGSAALLEMIRGDDSTHLAITPDGPRGPRRELKPGLVMVASQAGIPIVPLGIGFTRAWRASSWDRFAIPLPFTTLVGVIGEPVNIPSTLDRREMARHTEAVQTEMLRLTELAEDWARRLRKSSRAAPPEVSPSAELRKSA